jgi:predicted DNA-binding transcriptional regulator YafY
MDNERMVTVKVAAKALGVSIKTVHRYLDTGRLTRIKDGQRAYIPAEEIRALRGELEGGGKQLSMAGVQTITITVERYEALLMELGEARQKEQLLLEYHAEVKQKEARIAELEAALAQAKTPWWKRWLK